MGRIFSITILLFVIGTYTLEAQNANLEVIGFVLTANSEPIISAKADIYEGSTKVKTVNTDSKGKISFTLDYNKSYKIIISKAGMIEKRIDFKTEVEPEDQRSLRKEFGMTLVDDCDGADVSAFKEPADVITFDKGFGNFVSDQAHFEKMQSRFATAYRNLEKCKEDKFQDKKLQADQQYKQGNFEEAIELYEEALKIKPTDGASKRQISQAKKNIVKQQANSQQYDKLILEADQFLAQNKLSVAQQKYSEAARLNASSSYPQEKLTEIKKIIAQQTAENQKREAENNEYNNLIKQGNAALAAKNYPLAQQMFEKASVIKPSESLAKQKIAEAQQALQKQEQQQAENLRIEKAYQDAIAAASAAMQQSDFIKAQEHYQSAITLKPSEALPRQKLVEAEKMEAQRQQNLIAQQRAEVDKNYNDAIAKANSALTQKLYTDAISAFEQAMVIKPSDKYAQQQIVKINNLIVEESQAKQAAIEQQYNQSISLGDSKKINKEFDQAIEAYKQALVAKPKDPSAAAKLAEAQKLLADKNRMDKEEQETRASYNEFLQKGDALFQSLKYSESKNMYQQALGLYSTEQYPKNQITKIDNLVSKQEQEAKYNSIITVADGLFSQRSWNEAKAKYGEALLVLPDNAYPREKINEINQNISGDAKAAIEKKYNELVAQAEQEVVKKSFAQAKSLYAQAQQVLPENPYPQQRINEINQMVSDNLKAETEESYNKLAEEAEQQITQKNYEQAKSLYAQAQQIIPENPYPQQRINEINQMIDDVSKSAVQDKYNNLTTQAEQQVTQKNYDQAKSLYAQAQQVLPENPYPQQRINEINQMIDNDSKSAIQDKYNNLTTQAEQQVTQKNYDQAKSLYTQAQLVLPENPYPQQRINEINLLIDNDSKQGKLDNYNNLVSQADTYFGNQEYGQAKSTYNQALQLMPSESYPQQKINEINQLVSNLSKQKITDEYNSLIANADQLLSQQNYNEASSAYQKALTVIPEQSYPRQKLNEINAILTEQARLEASKGEVENSYNQTIALADKFFMDKNYPLATAEYRKSMGIKPGEQYPSQQIEKIKQLIAAEQQLAIQNLEQEKKYKESIAKADEEFKAQDYANAKSSYQTAIGFKPADVHANSQIQRIDQIMAEKLSAEQKKEQRDAQYYSIISNADNLYNANKLNDAKLTYQSALEVIPGHDYPRSQIRKINEKLRVIAANNAAAKAMTQKPVITTVAPATKTPTTSNKKLDEVTFKSENDRKHYLDELKKKYDKGVTKEVFKDKTSTINRYVVIRNGEVNEFREIIFKWGTQYKVNGKPTNSFYLNSQVKPRDGENFKELTM